MKDFEFKKKLEAVYKAKIKHSKLLKEAETEYENRYGSNPSEVDDDFWIDTFHGGGEEYDFKKIIEAANFSNNII